VDQISVDQLDFDQMEWNVVMLADDNWPCREY